MPYYIVTDAEGRPFHGNKLNTQHHESFRAVPGELLAVDPRGGGDGISDPRYYLSATPFAAAMGQLVHGTWPIRLFKVDPLRFAGSRRATEAKVLSEIGVYRAFGPNGRAVVRFLAALDSLSTEHWNRVGLYLLSTALPGQLGSRVDTTRFVARQVAWNRLEAAESRAGETRKEQGRLARSCARFATRAAIEAATERPHVPEAVRKELTDGVIRAASAVNLQDRLSEEVLADLLAPFDAVMPDSALTRTTRLRIAAAKTPSAPARLGTYAQPSTQSEPVCPTIW